MNDSIVMIWRLNTEREEIIKTTCPEMVGCHIKKEDGMSLTCCLSCEVFYYTAQTHPAIHETLERKDLKDYEGDIYAYKNPFVQRTLEGLL